MTDFTISVSSTFSLLGGSPVNQWGTLVWQSAGAATIYNLWGTQEDLPLFIGKNIITTIGLSSTQGKDVTKGVTETLDLSSTVAKQPTKGIVNTLSIDSDLTNLTKKNSIWDYVYPDGTTNAVDREITSYTSDSASAVSWFEQTYTTSTWTEV